MILTLIISPFGNLANANEAKETVVVEQVGTSGGIPAIKAQVKNAAGMGTYTLALTSPNNGSAHSQILNNTGKATTYVPNNFDGNGTYKYTLYANGLSVAEGGVNLVSSKKTPKFVVVSNGTDITIDIKQAEDYVSQIISFKSGEYSGRLEVTGASMQRAFENAKSLGPTMTFTGPVGDLVTVDVQKGEVTGGGNKPTPPTVTPPTNNTGSNDKNPTPSPNNSGNNNNVNNNGGNNSSSGVSNNTNDGNNNSGGNTNTSNGGGNANTGGNGNSEEDTTGGNVDTGGSQSNNQQNVNGRGEVWAISDADNITKNIKLTLNKGNFRTEHTMVAKAELFHKDYAGKSVTIRLDADRESTTSLITLDPNGKGTATFKIPVPQPSSKKLTAAAYSISGSLLDQVSVNYTIENEVDGKGGQTDDDTARISYMALDLTTLDKRKAVLSWYGAKNIHKYDTRLRVINNTTKDEHIYSVFIPDGESKINMNLVYDGPGIYTWELYVDGKVLIQSPYSTPVEVDGTPTSQNGLPVLKTYPNKNLQTAYTDGVDPNAVGGSTIGDELGAEVVADDFTQIDNQANQEMQEESSKGKTLIIILVVMVLLVGGVVAFFVMKRKNEDDDNGTGFKKYEGDDENGEHPSDEDEEDFKEA